MQSLDKQYFDDVYAANEDPWDFEKSEYEQSKYAATISALTKEKYQNVFEIGCSIGVLTEMLTRRSDAIFAIDISEKPLEIARRRLAGNSSVSFQKMSVPEEFPQENFDLILLSEVGYYLSLDDLKSLQNKLFAHLNPEGQLLLVHWTPVVHDYPLTGDQVHESFQSFADEKHQLTNLLSERKEKYRLDLFQKVS